MEAQKEQRRLLFLLEHTSDLVSIADLGGMISYVNAAGLKMLGLNAPEDAKRHVTDYMMPSELGSNISGTWVGALYFCRDHQA